MADAPTGYDDLKRLAEQLRRPLGTLSVLAPKHDPFMAGRAGRLLWAQWFGETWKRLGFGDGTHLRRVHYVLISQERPLVQPDGAPYRNTEDCWTRLGDAGRDARYLALVPPGAFVD